MGWLENWARPRKPLFNHQVPHAQKTHPHGANCGTKGCWATANIANWGQLRANTLDNLWGEHPWAPTILMSEPSHQISTYSHITWKGKNSERLNGIYFLVIKHQDRGEAFDSSRRVFPPPAAKDEPPEGMRSGSKGDVSAIFSEGLSLKHYFFWVVGWLPYFWIVYIGTSRCCRFVALPHIMGVNYSNNSFSVSLQLWQICDSRNLFGCTIPDFGTAPPHLPK